jgi:hypothetical protein
MSFLGEITGVWFKKISPDEGFSKPANIMSRVDFPQPEGPRSETNSPCLISRSAGPKATKGPSLVAKTLETPLILIAVFKQIFLEKMGGCNTSHVD